GAITLLTAYSYVKLTLHFGENGGAFSFVEHVVTNPHVAGFLGWVLVAGYIGVMAMYAFAFGAYTLTAADHIFGAQLPGFLRPVISVAIVALFIGINLRGVHASGLYEDIAVYVKVFILISLAALGIAYFRGDWASIDFFDRGYMAPIAAFAIIFVSYEGFQLLMYDYNDIEDVQRNLPRGTYIAVGIAMLIYISVSLMATLQLTPQELLEHKETALAKAVSNIPVLSAVGFALVILSAMKSTSSGINATLFGASRLAHRIATEEEMPRIFSFRDHRGIPRYSLIIMGCLTAAFAALGSLEQITEFGSVAFLIADAAANYACLRLWRDAGAHPVPPALGLAGTVIALPVLIHHLYVTQQGILWSIAAIFVGLLIAEFLFIERGPIRDYVTQIAGGRDAGEGAGGGEAKG
ncbi:MAG: APC family permease, partial [Armatimonadota bacterium]